MAMYTIRMIKSGRTIVRKQVSGGSGRDAAVIQAQADVTYLLGDTLDNIGPNKISTKRVGKNLQVAIGKGNPDIPDLIIEGYFDFAPAAIAGGLAEGGQATYDLGLLSAPTTGSTATAPAATAVGDNHVAQANLPSEGIDKTTMLLAGLGGALALGGLAGGKGGGDKAAAPETVALAVVTTFAADGSKPAPTVTDYTDIGVKNVSITNLAAINSAIDVLPTSKVDNKANIQIVVDAYNKILAEANGSTPDATPGSNPSDSDYAAIGANIGLASSNPAALALLNDVIGNLTTTAIDTIAEINAIAAVIDKVMNTAAGVASPLSVADFALLGLPTTGAGAVNAVNLGAVNNAIGSAGGQIKVDTFAELSGLVSAVATIASYANDNTQVAPTLAQYTTAGITGITASNLGAINSAVDANATTGVDTNVELQTIVDTYNLILAEANGSAADATPAINPTAVQYATIGANIGLATSNAQALSLLNDVIGNLSTTAVDTVAEINTLAGLVDKVMNTAIGSASPLSVADYALLGLPTAGPGAVTAINVGAVNNALATAGGQNRVDTYAELSSLVSAVATIVSYADDNTLAAPTLAQYNAAGITGVTAANLSAVNRAVDANIATGVDTKAELQAVVNIAINPIIVQNPDDSYLIAAHGLGKFTNTGIEYADVNSLSAVHSAVDAQTVDALEHSNPVQSLLDAYHIAFVDPNGASTDTHLSGNPAASNYAAIGTSIGLASGGILNGTDLASSAFASLDSAVASMLTTATNRTAEIDAFGFVVEKVLTTASLSTGSGIPMAAIPMTDLLQLNVSTNLTNAGKEISAIFQAILDTPNTSSSVNTILALQAIVNANAT
jgi:hypothetical protein